MLCHLLQVSVQNIDEDLFGSGGSNEGAMYQPSDRSYTRIKKSAQDIVREAYAEDMVRHRWPFHIC